MPAHRPLASLATLALACAHGAPAGGAPREVRLEPWAGRLRTVTAEVGGAPARLLLDTGAGITVLTPQAAAAAGCTVRGRATGFRMSGERLDLETCAPATFRLGGRTRAPEAALLDLARLLPPDLPPAAGALALQSFAGETLTLDLGGGKLSAEPGATRAPPPGASPLEVRAQRELSGGGLTLLVAVEGRRGPLWFLLDSGNLDDVLVAPHALADVAEGAALAALRGGGSVELALPLAGLGKVPVRARARELIYDGVLNAALLERLVLTLDLETVRAWARAR